MGERMRDDADVRKDYIEWTFTKPFTHNSLMHPDSDAWIGWSAAHDLYGAEIARLKAEVEQLRGQNYKLIDDCEREATKAATAEAERDRAIKAYTDEAQVHDVAKSQLAELRARPVIYCENCQGLGFTTTSHGERVDCDCSSSSIHKAMGGEE